MGVAPRSRVEELLRGREPTRVPDHRTERRAAVVLLLRDPGEDEAPTGQAGEGGGLSPHLGRLEALFVLRAERDGDPWSGHVGLPGGHREPGDPDLVAAALRELEEEVGLTLARGDVLGRLDDVHPRSRRLPSVAVTPFVGWLDAEDRVRAGVEVADHFWMSLEQMETPGRRSVLTVSRGDAVRAFPTIEAGDHTIWGLTFVIASRFLDLLPDPGTEGEEGSRRRRSAWPTY